MFGKSTKAPAGEAASAGGPARKSPRPASLLAAELVIVGDLTSEGELQIDGQVRGDVKAPSVTLGESGSITGDVEAEHLDIRGRLIGAIAAKAVRLAATSHVEGDITHEQLTIEAGAFFEGRSLKPRDPLAGAELVMISAASRQA